MRNETEILLLPSSECSCEKLQNPKCSDRFEMGKKMARLGIFPGTGRPVPSLFHAAVYLTVSHVNLTGRER